jgi:hypothetical protein
MSWANENDLLLDKIIIIERSEEMDKGPTM